MKEKFPKVLEIKHLPATYFQMIWKNKSMNLEKCKLIQSKWKAYECSLHWYSNFSIGLKVKTYSCVHLFVTPWTRVRQAPLSMEFSRQEYWRGWPIPSPGHLPNPGIELVSPTLQVDSLPPKLENKTINHISWSFFSDCGPNPLWTFNLPIFRIT